MGDVRKSKRQSKKQRGETTGERVVGSTQRMAHALQERVKELTCLYTVAEILQKQVASLDDLSTKILEAIVAAYQYPEVTAVRILLVGSELNTLSLKQTKWKQDSPIMAGGYQVGTIEVYYLEERPESDEGPFMKEERSLLNAIAYQLGTFIERRRLDESRQLLSAIVESSRDAIIGKTLDGIITSWNKGAEVNYGYTAAEAIGQPIYMLVPSERRGEVDQFLEVIRGGGSVVNQESVRVTKFGRLVTVLLTISPIKDASGKIIGVSTIAQNITEFKRAANEIKRVADEWQTTFDSIIDMVSIQDKDFKIVRVNKAYADAVGMKMEDVVGKHCYEVVHNTSSNIVNCPHQRTIETKKAITQEVFEPKLNAYLEVSTSPIFDSDGEVIGSVHIAKNITERKREDEEIVVLSNAFRAALDPILILDMDGTVRNVNEAARRLFETKELGVSALDYAVPEDREKVIVAIQGLIAGSGVNTTEFTIVTKSGRRVPIEATGSLIRDLDGKAIGFVVVERDISERKQAEEVLRQFVDRLSLATRAGGVGIWDYDVVNNKLIWDDQMYHLYGITQDKFGGAYEAWRVGLHPEDMQRGDNEIQMALRGEKEFDTEFRVLWPDGTIRNIRALAIVQRDASGKPLRMIGTNWDITERKKAEEALRESEKKFRVLFEDSLDAVLISNIEGRIIDFNQSLSTLVGYSREELLNLNAKKLYMNSVARERFQKEIVSTGSVRDYTVKWVRKDGMYLDVLMTLTIRTDIDGNIVGYQGIVRDVTERKKLEEALQQSEKKYRDLAELLPQTVFEIDIKGRFIYTNRYGLESTGYTQEDFAKGVNAIELFVPEQREIVIGNIKKVLSGEQFDDHEYTILRKDGNTYPALIYTNAIIRDGQPVGIRGIVVDITERKKVEQMKTDFVSFISHQLRTPVAGLMGYIDNMLEGITGELNDRQVEYLSEMRDVCTRNNRLIADLLNISRLERGVLSVNLQPVKLINVVEIAAKEYVKDIKQKGLALNIKEIDQGLSVLADSDKLAEVLKNVIHNALKFTREGSINIDIISDGSHGIIKVSDTGLGLPEEVMKDLFKREKVLSGAVSAGGGAGLGLYIANGFMKLQGGDIMVESVMGKGSTFIISLPRK